MRDPNPGFQVLIKERSLIYGGNSFFMRFGKTL